MSDREKVIQGLECCVLRNPDDKPRCGECPYEGACLNRLKHDALAIANDYDHLLHLAKAMHTWIFLNTFDEQAVYDELGFTDEDNALLGSIGRPMVIGTVKPNRQPVHPGAAKVEDATGTTSKETD